MDVVQVIGGSSIRRGGLAKLLRAMDAPQRTRVNDPRRVIASSGICAGNRVLEVGCGSGFFTPALSAAVGAAGAVESIDLHPMSVAATREKVGREGLTNVTVTEADAHHTAFADSSFDVVAVYGVVPAPFISERRLAAEACRVLKPGGTLVVWTAVPFWSPRALLKGGDFVRHCRSHRVHQLYKAS